MSQTRVLVPALALTVVLLLHSTETQPAVGARSPGTRTVPTGLTLMLTGDSVSLRLEDAVRTRARNAYGWDMVSTAIAACSLLGDPFAWPDGTYKEDPTKCDIVVPTQDAALTGSSPDYVIWWDRLSQMSYMTRTDPAKFVYSGSRRFWRRRVQDIRARAKHFRESGAMIVFVATEPMGIGVYQRCTTWDKSPNCAHWVRFRMEHYADVTRRWNKILRRYAAHHSDSSVYVTLTPEICHEDSSPCDDTVNGRLARPDGTHYKDVGARKAARVLLHQMELALFPAG